jgi:hypothetical protein
VQTPAEKRWGHVTRATGALLVAAVQGVGGGGGGGVEGVELLLLLLSSASCFASVHGLPQQLGKLHVPMLDS